MQKSNSNNLLISIIIPVRNDPQNLQKCLQAVADSEYSNYECIVVDDGSSDNTPAVARQFPVKLLKLPRNFGPAYARNEGAKIAIGDILYFFDADVVIYPDTLTKIAEVFTKQPEIDAAIGSYDDEPANSSFISQYKNLFHHYVHQQAGENSCIFWSGCGAVRRKVFLKFGGFDIRYGRPAIEDIELGFRLTANRCKIALCKEIQIKHLKRWTFWGLLKTDIFDRAVPWTVVMLRDRFFPKSLNLQASQRVSVILVYLLLFLVGVLIFYSRLPAFVLIFPFLILLTLLIFLNHKFYEFFLKKRGFLFALKVFPFHILYYFYSGLGLMIGVFAYLLKCKI